MIIVNFSDIADVPPQSVDKPILEFVLKGCNKLIEDNSEDELGSSIMDWEMELYYNRNHLDDDWYTKALVCICLRGLRGESRPNILNISE